MSDVTFAHVGKSYGPVRVIEDLNLDIDSGTFTVLLGPSGCGKTTLLRMVAGLEAITEGDISIGGRRINDVHPRDRDIAMVFQNYALYPTMTVFQNIGFALEVAKTSKPQIKEKVENIAQILNLTEYLSRYPKELSGGQRQRVAMGRAMVRDAKVFLFDEPLSNLDAKLRSHMRVETRLLHDRLAATTIYVTHDQIEAMTMADKIVLMREGRIIQTGTPDELYDVPNCLYTAEFIGAPAMNFLGGQLSQEHNQWTFNSPYGQIALPDVALTTRPEKVICGVRPADLQIDPQGSLHGTLTVNEKTGADLNLHIRLEDDKAPLDLVAVVPRDAHHMAPGQEVRLAIKPGKAHLFDAVSEQRLSA
ncbi:MAG: ABC transporter ATP-binding protein [Pseudomonadota bacterium]